MIYETKIITKILIGILGFSLIGSAVILQNNSNANNSIKTSQAANNSYDFYSKFGTETKLTKEYFTKSLKNKNEFAKIRIDSLPLHSSLSLSNIPTQIGQEINFEEVNKLTFKSSIDEYDQFNWSGYVDSAYLPSVTMKVGVGGISLNINVITPFNTPYNSNNLEFQSAVEALNLTGFVYGGIKISSLPTNGVIKYNNGTIVNIYQAMTPIDLDSLVYIPNLNYVGMDQFQIHYCSPQELVNNTNFCNTTIGSFSITIEPGIIASSSMISSSAISSSVSLSSVSSITPIVPLATSAGGAITISNNQPTSSQNTTSSSSKPTSSTTTPEPSASTKIFDPKKLLNNKTKPSFGVLSSADDKAAIEDPYDCAGDVHGAVEYSGDYNNIEVKVNVQGKTIYELPLEFDRKTGTYVAKVDYDIVSDGEYIINYKVISKLSSKTLDEASYKVFITQKCESVKEIIVENKVNEINLARTGGNQTLINLPLIIIIIVGIVSCLSLAYRKE